MVTPGAGRPPHRRHCRGPFGVVRETVFRNREAHVKKNQKDAREAKIFL